MDDVTRGLERIAEISPYLTQWHLEAMNDWHDEHSVKSRVRLSSLTRDNYFYDQLIARAESVSTPIPIRVPQYGRMRWLIIEDGDLDIALWPKKIDPRSFLTSSYPTKTAVRRQRNWEWALFARRMVFFVCGHTIQEDIAGSEAWIDQIVLTQEARDKDGIRRATLKRPIYYKRVGPIPLQVEDRQFPLIPDAVVTTPVVPGARVVVRKPPGIAGGAQMPRVGIDAAKRAAEQLDQKRQEEDGRKGGSQGA